MGSLGFLFDVDGPGGGSEMRRLWELEGAGVGAGGEDAGGEDIIEEEGSCNLWGGGRASVVRVDSWGIGDLVEFEMLGGATLNVTARFYIWYRVFDRASAKI